MPIETLKRYLAKFRLNMQYPYKVSLRATIDDTSDRNMWETEWPDLLVRVTSLSFSRGLHSHLPQMQSPRLLHNVVLSKEGLENDSVYEIDMKTAGLYWNAFPSCTTAKNLAHLQPASRSMLKGSASTEHSQFMPKKSGVHWHTPQL